MGRLGSVAVEASTVALLLGWISRQSRTTTLKFDDLRGGRRKGNVAEPFGWLVGTGVSVRRVALRLGRDDSSFVRPLVEVETRLASDPALRSRLDRLVQSLDGPPPEP